MSEVETGFINEVLAEHTPPEGARNYCPACVVRHPCGVHTAIIQLTADLAAARAFDTKKTAEVTHLIDMCDELTKQLAEANETNKSLEQLLSETDSYHCCPECCSTNVEHIHPTGDDDFGAFKCHECNHQGEIGEDFPCGTELRAKLAAANAMQKAYSQALTPSAESKRAHMGSYKFDGPEDSKGRYQSHTVPWTTIKEIMHGISVEATEIAEAARTNGDTTP